MEESVSSSTNPTDVESTVRVSAVVPRYALDKSTKHAVEVVALHKSYGGGKNKLMVLENLQMSVPCGAM